MKHCKAWDLFTGTKKPTGDFGFPQRNTSLKPGSHCIPHLHFVELHGLHGRKQSAGAQQQAHGHRGASWAGLRQCQLPSTIDGLDKGLVTTRWFCFKSSACWMSTMKGFADEESPKEGCTARIMYRLGLSESKIFILWLFTLEKPRCQWWLIGIVNGDSEDLLGTITLNYELNPIFVGQNHLSQVQYVAIFGDIISCKN